MYKKLAFSVTGLQDWLFFASAVIGCYEARNVMSSVLNTVVVSHQRKLGQLQMTATATLRVTVNGTTSNE